MTKDDNFVKTTELRNPSEKLRCICSDAIDLLCDSEYSIYDIDDALAIISHQVELLRDKIRDKLPCKGDIGWFGKDFSKCDFTKEDIESLTVGDMGAFSEFKKDNITIQVGTIRSRCPVAMSGGSITLLCRTNKDNVWSGWRMPNRICDYYDTPFEERAELYYKNNISS